MTRANAADGAPLDRPLLITGAMGAVGRYVVEELLSRGALHLVVLARDPSRVRSVFGADSRVEVIAGDLAQARELASRLPPVAGAVLLAAAWDDGPRAWQVNVDGHVALAAGLRRVGCRRVIWFGTASVLDGRGDALPEADRLGTPYIASKAEARRRLRADLGDTLSIVHPTLVVAGDAVRPHSHVARLVPTLERHAWLLRYLSLEGTLHLVHARDLARLSRQLLEWGDWSQAPREIIAGAPAISAREALDLVLSRVGVSRRAAVALSPRRADTLRRLLGIRLSPWDAHCLAIRHFRYEGALLSLRAPEAPHHATARAILDALPR